MDQNPLGICGAMKLMFAECCRSLVVPNHNANHPAHCRCGLAACWWTHPENGDFAVWHHTGNRNLVSVVGIHNRMFTTSLRPGGSLAASELHDILDGTPPNYLFRQLGSLVVRFRPGYTSDTFFVKELP